MAPQAVQGIFSFMLFDPSCRTRASTRAMNFMTADVVESLSFEGAVIGLSRLSESFCTFLETLASPDMPERRASRSAAACRTSGAEAECGFA
jgi:hypothetical protein